MTVRIPKAHALCVLAVACLSMDTAISQDESDMAVHMQEHLVRLTDVKTSILTGEIGEARGPATWLARSELPDSVAPMYETFMVAMRGHARDIVEARTITSAAAGVADIATDCAGCHTAMGIDLKFGFDEEPPLWSDMQSHMQRHQWAVDRLWEGLIGPSDASWARGIRMLAEAPLLGTENSWGEAAEGGDALARRVHELGVEAATALTPEARSRVYANIIGACAECHSRTGGGPRGN